MLDPRTGEEEREKIAADARSRLEAKGSITNEADWGMRKMAYEIEQQRQSDYRYYRFEGGNDLLDDLNHSLRIADGVLRFRIFKVEPEAPMITPPDTEQIMRRDEEDDRGRGRGRRDDRGPRRPREDSEPAADASAEPAAPAASAEAPEQPASAESGEQAEEASPAEPGDQADEAPSQAPSA